MSLANGTRLGPYEITGALGAGGMGEVYRAHDARLQRDVAIKVPRADAVSDPISRARLMREARSAAALNHPDVCTIHDVGESGGHVYIAMELVEGASLDQKIPPGGLPVDRVLHYGGHVVEAVAHAHSRGIVHRDLKPSNVRVTPDDRVKVLDFGLARRTTREDLADATTETESALTEAGKIVGTIPYMAPEQLRGQPGDMRSDVWALGVMLHEMASGARPFRAGTSFDVSSKILGGSPDELPATVPANLRAVIERCLDKGADRRYQNAGEVHAALDAIRSGTAPEHFAGRRQSWNRTWLVPMVVVVAALGLLFDVGGLRSMMWGSSASAEASIRLAVLPFRNLTGDPGQDYLSDGMTEEMIAQLARLDPDHLSVIARTSSMRFRNMAASNEEVGRQLRVDYLLDSSLRREGDRVRVNVALIEVSDQTLKWTESFERELSSIFVLEDEVANGVASALALRLLPDESARAQRTRAVDPRAYEAYLKGRMHWYRAEVEIARGYFEEAVQIDPDYALAYVGLADATATAGQVGRAPVHEAFASAKETLAHALELDDTLPEAVDLDARIKFAYDWNWSAAEARFQTAIRLNPNYPDVRVVHGQLLRIRGQPEAALAEVRRALELDPQNPFFQQQLAMQLASIGRYDEAIRHLLDLLDAQPEYRPAYSRLWEAYYKTNREDEALDAAVRSIEDPELSQLMRRAYGEAGYAAAMKRAADALVERSRDGPVGPVPVARFYVHAGQVERALDWLETAVEAHAVGVVYTTIHSDFEAVWRHPRYQDIRRQLHLD